MRLCPSLPALLAVAALGGSCSLWSGRSGTVVALDEAFAAARPELASKLESRALLGAGPWGLFGAPTVDQVKLDESAGKAIDLAQAELKRSGKRVILVTSPLVAKAIVGGQSWTGDPALLVPEWLGNPVDGLTAATTDPIPAYAAAGEAAGTFIAALTKESGQPSCGVVYSESPSRPRAAMSAFAEAYSTASDGKPLYVREISEAAPSGTGSVPAPSDEAASAVKELLGSDIRVLFLALGASAGTAVDAAQRPGLAIGTDSVSSASSSLAFSILPDDEGLAKAIAAIQKQLRRSGQSLGPGAAVFVPALLIAGPAARTIQAGKEDFASFLAAALSRRKWLRSPGRRAPSPALRAKALTPAAGPLRGALACFSFSAYSLTKDYAENIILLTAGSGQRYCQRSFKDETAH